MSAALAAERVARASYGRLVSLLAASTRDIAAAEEALAEAFAAALAAWPARGVPDNPEAWLLTTARNFWRNTRRAQNVRSAALDEIERRTLARAEGAPLEDNRLALLFVCAHPAIDPTIRTPLMLQTVLGLDAARIGSAFAVSPSAMAQRLVRAKIKIKEAGIRFELPNAEDLPDRLAAVLEAVYGAFAAGWDAVATEDQGLEELVDESLYLGRLLVELAPAEPEAKGLLALMLYCEARRPARFDREGRFVPLAEQDARLWNRDMVIEAEAWLGAASREGRFGRFQCEAAIQSVHAIRAVTGVLNHAALDTLYSLLAAHAPTLGVLVAQAAAKLEAGDAEAALVILDSTPIESRATYQPYWTTRWRCLEVSGRTEDAKASLEKAIGLTEHPAVRAYLMAQRPKRDDGSARTSA
jgi:RNA polymerase sigma-70 factor (ECF subfamily)